MSISGLDDLRSSRPLGTSSSCVGRPRPGASAYACPFVVRGTDLHRTRMFDPRPGRCFFPVSVPVRCRDCIDRTVTEPWGLSTPSNAFEEDDHDSDSFNSCRY